MWTELLQLFRGDEPVKAMADELMQMLDITRRMAEAVRPHVFDHLLSLEKRKEILDLDVDVGRLERSVRRKIVAHLSLQKSQVPYCMALWMMVNHAERIGDYVKNVAEVEQLGGGEVPEGPLRNELNDLIDIATRLLDETPKIIAAQNGEAAEELIRIGKNARKRSDKLLVELSKSDLSPSQTTAMVLLTRFYRRIIGHAADILTAIVMPVHQMHFFGDIPQGET